ncbi:collagen alpha-1(III) chain-like [Columba livia]|uniref:collagen alpha-1(III) chain-like n=1 Tax=Columba livia TaxID=8932 RepID=UPI0031BA53B7
MGKIDREMGVPWTQPAEDGCPGRLLSPAPPGPGEHLGNADCGGRHSARNPALPNRRRTAGRGEPSAGRDKMEKRVVNEAGSAARRRRQSSGRAGRSRSRRGSTFPGHGSEKDSDELGKEGGEEQHKRYSLAAIKQSYTQSHGAAQQPGPLVQFQGGMRCHPRFGMPGVEEWKEGPAEFEHTQAAGFGSHLLPPRASGLNYRKFKLNEPFPPPSTGPSLPWSPPPRSARQPHARSRCRRGADQRRAGGGGGEAPDPMRGGSSEHRTAGSPQPRPPASPAPPPGPSAPAWPAALSPEQLSYPPGDRPAGRGQQHRQQR